MKKSVFFLTLILSLAACGGASTDNPDPTPTVNNCTESTTPDAYCAALDSETPFCDVESAACVASCLDTASPDAFCATADASQPLCDRASGNCVECTEHSQCASGACDAFVGECFEVGNVLQVGVGQTYATINDALAQVSASDLVRAVLVLHEGTAGGSFNEVVTVDSGAVALVAAEGYSPDWFYALGTSPTLTANGMETRVYVAGIRISTNNDPDVVSVVSDGARIDIRRSRIGSATEKRILVSNQGELVLRNSFVGGSSADVPTLTVNGATARILYSTLGGGFFATALTCDATAMVEIRNSLLLARDDADEIQCPNAIIDYSAAEQALGGNNMDLVNMDTNWFIGYNVGDFHLTNQAPASLATTATWREGDPTVDIDGDPRPTTDGSPDYAGADVP